jgi:ElaB/YqjD/DUF883 family membrane-anchored ribosome-binding protein
MMSRFLKRLADRGDPDFDAIAEQLDSLSRDLGRYTTEVGRSGRRKGQQLATSARRSGRSGLSAMGNLSSDARRRAEDVVSEHPGTSLGAVLFVGLILGFLLARR